MKKFLISATLIFDLVGLSTMAMAEQSVTRPNASRLAKDLGKDWGGFVSEGAKATNSGMADGNESTTVTLPIGGLPFRVEVSDPGVASTFGATNKGKEE